MTHSRLSIREASLPFNLSPTAAVEWRAISAEPDPELRAESGLALAGRLESRGEEPAAAFLYQSLSEDAALDSGLRRRAQRALDGLRGRGSFGQNAERFFRHFIRESSDPAALLAMGVAGATFRAVRLGTMARLFASPAATWSRGWGARAVAGMSGLAAESFIFPVAGRLGQGVLGRSLDWNASTLGREWASGLIMLGALRAGGVVTGYLARNSRAQNHLAAGLITQLGMLGGISLAQHLESRIGWRDEAPHFSEVLSTLLHFNVAGRLSRLAFGRNFAAWEQRMDIQAEAIRAAPARTFEFPSRTPAYAMAGVEVGKQGAEPIAASRFPPSLYRNFNYPSGRGEAKPPLVRYSPEFMRRWKTSLPRLADLAPQRSVAKTLERMLPLEEANRLWREQIEDFSRLIGASLEVHGSERLRAPLGRGFLLKDPGLLRKAREFLGRDAEVYELQLPFTSLRFGEPNEKGNYSDLLNLLQELQVGYGHQIYLSYTSEGKSFIRLPSLELWDALNAVHFGENAHRLVPVDGLIARNQVMGLRQNLLAPLGLVRQATPIQELGGQVHPMFFAFHDGYHASVASTLPAGVARLTGRLYQRVRRSLPPSPLKEELLDRFADLDPGTEYKGDSNSYWQFTLNHYWKFFQRDIARDDFIENYLIQYPEFIDGYRSLLQRISPRNSEEAKSLQKISFLLDENSRRMSSLLVEVLRK